MSNLRSKARVAIIGIAALSVAACGGASSSPTGAPVAASLSPTAAPVAASPTASAAPVSLEFYSSVAGMEPAIAAWNKANPSIQIKLNLILDYADLYTKMRAAVQAGQDACLGTLAYDAFPSFVTDGLIQDVNDAVAQYKDTYIPWTWNQVTVGGRTYGIPQDSGPVVLFYRKDLFQEDGIEPPKTWEDYAAAAKTLHAKDPTVSLGYVASDDQSFLTSLAWQNGAHWYQIDGDHWVVSIDDQPTQAVAQFWQGLIDSGDIPLVKRWEPSFYKQVADGKILSLVGAAWNQSLLAQNLEGQAGKWAVAQMPSWAGKPDVTANHGGSGLAVLKNCKYPEQALTFAQWFNSSEESMNTLASTDGSGLYPAAQAALNYPIVNAPSVFYGGQVIGEEFKTAAAGVITDWAWSPVESQTFSYLDDALLKVASGDQSLEAMYSGAQEQALKDLVAKGINATAGN